MSVRGLNWDENLGGFYMYDHDSFIIQYVVSSPLPSHESCTESRTVCLIIAPTFWSAANYIFLGRLINSTGGRYCIITPRSFAILFMLGDFLCLVVQGVGGGWAGTATESGDADKGALVMTAGVILQRESSRIAEPKERTCERSSSSPTVVITVAFIVLLVDFLRRYFKDLPVENPKHPLPNWGFLGRPKRDEFAQAQLSSNASREHFSSGTSTPSGGKAEFGIVDNAFQEVSSKKVKIAAAALSFTTLLIVIR